jgi:hypothetical protein
MNDKAMEGMSLHPFQYLSESTEENKVIKSLK